MSDSSKKDYIKKLEAKLREWSVDIDKLREKAGNSEEKIKEEFHKKIDELHIKSEDIKKRIQKLKEESGEAWEEIKVGTEDLWQEMKAAVEKVKSKFK